MFVNDTKVQVIDALRIIKEAAADRTAAVARAQNVYVNETLKSNQLLNAIREQYESIAVQVAINNRQVPRDYDGCFISPAYVSVVEDGILMSWEDDRWDGKTHIITWEQLTYKPETPTSTVIISVAESAGSNVQHKIESIRQLLADNGITMMEVVVTSKYDESTS
jgi:hypothetical protein